MKDLFFCLFFCLISALKSCFKFKKKDRTESCTEMEAPERSGIGSPPLPSGRQSSLEQPWAVAEANRGDAAPPLIDIAHFRRDWQRTLAPLSPRIDHLHLLGDDPLDPDIGGGHDMMGDDAEEGLVPVPDLSCDDIFIGTPHQQIQAAIQREIVRCSRITSSSFFFRCF